MRTQTFNPKFREIAVNLTKKMSVGEAAAILGVGVSTLYTWKKNAREGQANLAIKPETKREIALLKKEKAKLSDLIRENAELKSKLVTISMLAKDTELPF